MSLDPKCTQLSTNETKDRFVILSGSAAGLASINLKNLLQKYADVVVPGTETLVWNLIEPHFSHEAPRVRLEAVFDIIQQYIDPNLSLLDVLFTDEPKFSNIHRILAQLAMKFTVITTDFDYQIEDAARIHLSEDDQSIPFDVFCTDQDFQAAYRSIEQGTHRDFTGLWKVHGTIAMWKHRKRILMRADEDGGPVVTLKKLSMTRECLERRYFIHYLLETRPFIIVNYSASDDFDLTRWLKTSQNPLHVIWIQHVPDCFEPLIWKGTDLIKSKSECITLLNSGVINIAQTWNEIGNAGQLTIVATVDPISFLIEFTGVNKIFSSKDSEIPNELPNNSQEYILSVPSPWQKYVVSGAILTHLSYFSMAKICFEAAVKISTVRTREYCIALVNSIEASIEIGDRQERIEAMKAAANLVRVAPLSLRTWIQKKSQFINASVKRFVEQNGQAIAIEELRAMLDQCGPPDAHPAGRDKIVIIEAASLLARLRRYQPSSPEPSEVAQKWIESIPKTGLLHTKATNLHELALNKYQTATSIDDIDDAIDIIQEASDVREELGYMRGLVASMNVHGSMQMRHSDWSSTLELNRIEKANELFRCSIKYSDKHGSVFDRFQARIHLCVCLFRYSAHAEQLDEIRALLDYFQDNRVEDVRSILEVEFCLAMGIFWNNKQLSQTVYEKGEQVFQTLANKYETYTDVRLIRIVAAARFNAELCRDWKNAHHHSLNPILSGMIITRGVKDTQNLYWQMRLELAEKTVPNNANEILYLFLDPLSP